MLGARTHKKLIAYLCVVVLGMFAFSFALVPLYDVFCEVTGINGKIDLSVTSALPNGAIEDRVVTVEFDVNYNGKMPWIFRPQFKTMQVRPGELMSTGYFVQNPTAHTMTAQAIPSIAPAIAAEHLKKVECFCFSQQILGPGQTANLPLRFYLDPKLPKQVKRLTLSYTLFDMTQNLPQNVGSNPHAS